MYNSEFDKIKKKILQHSLILQEDYNAIEDALKNEILEKKYEKSGKTIQITKYAIAFGALASFRTRNIFPLALTSIPIIIKSFQYVYNKLKFKYYEKITIELLESMSIHNRQFKMIFNYFVTKGSNTELNFKTQSNENDDISKPLKTCLLNTISLLIHVIDDINEFTKLLMNFSKSRNIILSNLDEWNISKYKHFNINTNINELLYVYDELINWYVYMISNFLCCFCLSLCCLLEQNDIDNIFSKVITHMHSKFKLRNSILKNNFNDVIYKFINEKNKKPARNINGAIQTRLFTIVQHLQLAADECYRIQNLLDENESNKCVKKIKSSMSGIDKQLKLTREYYNQLEILINGIAYKRQHTEIKEVIEGVEPERNGIVINPDEEVVQDICDLLPNLQIPLLDDEYELYIPDNYEPNVELSDESGTDCIAPISRDIMSELKLAINKVKFKRAQRNKIVDDGIEIKPLSVELCELEEPQTSKESNALGENAESNEDCYSDSSNSTPLKLPLNEKPIRRSYNNLNSSPFDLQIDENLTSSLFSLPNLIKNNPISAISNEEVFADGSSDDECET